jgi:hypothetical protein
LNAALSSAKTRIRTPEAQANGDTVGPWRKKNASKASPLYPSLGDMKMFRIENIAGKTPTAKRTRIVSTVDAARNSAKATSEFFHGVYEVKNTETSEIAGYYVNGRRYIKIDTAWAAH